MFLIVAMFARFSMFVLHNRSISVFVFRDPINHIFSFYWWQHAKCVFLVIDNILFKSEKTISRTSRVGECKRFNETFGEELQFSVRRSIMWLKFCPFNSVKCRQGYFPEDSVGSNRWEFLPKRPSLDLPLLVSLIICSQQSVISSYFFSIAFRTNDKPLKKLTKKYLEIYFQRKH